MDEDVVEYPILRVQTNLEKPSGHFMIRGEVRTKEFYCAYMGTLIALIAFHHKKITGSGLRKALRALANCKLPEIDQETTDKFRDVLEQYSRQMVVIVPTDPNLEQKPAIPMSGKKMIS